MKRATLKKVDRLLEERFGPPLSETSTTLIEAATPVGRVRHILEPGSRYATLCAKDDSSAAPFPQTERELDAMRGIAAPGAASQPTQVRYCARCIGAASKHIKGR